MAERYLLILLAKARGSKSGALLIVVGVLILFAFLAFGLASVVSDVASMVSGVAPVLEFLGTGLGVLVAVAVAALMVLLGVAFMINATPQPSPTDADSPQAQELERLRSENEGLKADKATLEKELRETRSAAAKLRTGTTPTERAERSIVATPTDRPTTPTTSASSGSAVGDTLTVESGISLTVLSYESPIPPPSFVQPDPDHDFSAVEVEWCAEPNYNGYINRASTSYFTLQMPDNTHLRGSALQAREPRLSDTPLVALGDCVRGWVTFQTPKGEVPKFVVFSGIESVVKWSIPQ